MGRKTQTTIGYTGFMPGDIITGSALIYPSGDLFVERDDPPPSNLFPLAGHKAAHLRMLIGGPAGSQAIAQIYGVNTVDQSGGQPGPTKPLGPYNLTRLAIATWTSGTLKTAKLDRTQKPAEIGPAGLFYAHTITSVTQDDYLTQIVQKAFATDRTLATTADGRAEWVFPDLGNFEHLFIDTVKLAGTATAVLPMVQLAT